MAFILIISLHINICSSFPINDGRQGDYAGNNRYLFYHSIYRRIKNSLKLSLN